MGKGSMYPIIVSLLSTSYLCRMLDLCRITDHEFELES